MEPDIKQIVPAALWDRYNQQVRDTIIGMIKSNAKPPQEYSIEAIRAQPEVSRLPCWIDTSSWNNVRDFSIVSRDGGEFPVRVYSPDAQRQGAGPYPVHLNFHGGGFVLGDLGAEASLCSKLCNGAGIVVVDVNYRHCPESSWGKCFEDAEEALEWVRKGAHTLNIQPESISIGGISAGGQISLAVQHMARDKGIPLKLCLVTVPVTTNALTYKSYEESPLWSFSEFREDVFLPWAQMQWFGKHCLSENHQDGDISRFPSWWFNPLQAQNMKGLCRTFIRTAEVDILRDEGEAYGRKVLEAGNEVSFKRYLGVPHLFPYFEDLDVTEQYMADSIEALKEAHGSKLSNSEPRK